MNMITSYMFTLFSLHRRFVGFKLYSITATVASLLRRGNEIERFYSMPFYDISRILTL